MARDKIVKNAWKDLAEKAGAQVKKLVESNEVCVVQFISIV